jgi:DNA-directed RNA polymerase specialized sigma24 family protein
VLEDSVAATELSHLDILALDEALKRLSALNGRYSNVVELRFFAGLSIQEVAEVLNVGTRTINGDWQFARTWLHRELTRGTHG